MATRATKTTPDGMHSVTPHIVCAGAAEALAFYAKAFGAVELSRMPGPNGKLMHASMRIGDSTVMLVDEAPEWQMLGPNARGGTSVTLHLYVPDADAAIAQAAAAGATVSMPAADMFWGDRYGVVRDPFGHHWSIATHQQDLSADEIAEAMRKMAAAGNG